MMQRVCGRPVSWGGGLGGVLDGVPTAPRETTPLQVWRITNQSYPYAPYPLRSSQAAQG